MIYRFLADAVLLLHLAFILFVVLGGFLVRHHPRLAWLHLPAATWGILVEITGQVCPLTPLENSLRRMAGQSGNGNYSGSFVEHYLLPVIYPEALTREAQIVLGLGVVIINIVAYAWRHQTGKRNEPQR